MIAPFALFCISFVLLIALVSSVAHAGTGAVQQCSTHQSSSVTLAPIKSRWLKLRGGEVKHPNNENLFDNELADAANKLVVVDFSASWCMPCKMIAPVFEEMALSDEYRDVVFIKVDVDENPEVSQRYQVMAMPTFLFLKNGKVVDRFSGASVEKLKETIHALL